MHQNEFAFTKHEDEKNIRDITEWYEKIKDRQPEEMAGFFTARADGYEKHVKSFYNDYHIFPKLLPEGAENILDLGCGTGLELDEIFKVFPDIKVTGIDMSEGMLRLLKNKHSDKDITLYCQDYFKYDFGRQKYDAVISVQSLHHFKYKKKKIIYAKIFEALKKDGVFIEADYTASSKEHEKLCLDFNQKQRARYNISDDMFIHIDIPITIEHRKELLLSAGFIKASTVYRIENTVITVAVK